MITLATKAGMITLATKAGMITLATRAGMITLATKAGMNVNALCLRVKCVLLFTLFNQTLIFLTDFT